LIVITQDANPFYDDSYAVNSANVGPYGDALTQELYPYVEKQFRAIGEPWARTVYGGSTGGWRALALQVFYPDFFNGAWVFCPDPIDFAAYAMVNLYKDDNAFFAKSQWKRVPIPMMREANGTISSDMDDALRFEMVLGTRGRSAEQFDIWQAVYSPVGEDGYPALIIDPRTGAIDHKVAQYWKDHYDLDYIMQRDWKTLGPKLTGKLHFAVGELDTYYLERAVHLTQQFLDSTREPGKGPYADATFDFGPGRPHGYTGDVFLPAPVASGTLTQRMMPIMMEHMLKTAPAGTDTHSWRY
jgi:Putative esterase